MVSNPLPEFVDQDGNHVQIDLELEDETSSDPQWMKKIKYRIGAIVIEFNYLERIADDLILEIMNDRTEDPMVWVFLERMTTYSKFDALFKLYDIFSSYVQFSDELLTQKKLIYSELDDIRVKRNLYVHANWYNTIRGDLVENKPKKIKSGSYGRFRKKISIADIDADIQKAIKVQDNLYDFHEEFIQTFHQAKEMIGHPSL